MWGGHPDLRTRVKQHLKNRHFALWTHFSLYLTTKSGYMDDIESILISIANPKGNRAVPKGTVNTQLKKNLWPIIKNEQKKKQQEELEALVGGRKSKRGPKINVKDFTLKDCFVRSMPLVATYKKKTYNAILLTSGEIKY